LTHLQTLDLKRTMVSDDGLKHLEALKELQMLRVDSNRITDAGIEKLRKALPGVTITR
jgi:hypothetical protein